MSKPTICRCWAALPPIFEDFLKKVNMMMPAVTMLTRMYASIGYTFLRQSTETAITGIILQLLTITCRDDCG